MEEGQSRRRWQRSHARALARWAKRYPQAAQATRALQAALNAKRLKKSDICQAAGCTSQRHIQAHHHDYSRPLEVLWCCAPCHKQGHSRGWIEPKQNLPRHLGAIPELLAVEQTQIT